MVTSLNGPFWESFESAVHTNAALSDVEKFNYLNSLLECSAKEAVSGLALTAANYEQAVATLKKQFGCKRVNKHMDAVLPVEGVTSSQNTRALRKRLDGVNSNIHSLQSLGVEPDSYSSLLCPVLIGKLPGDLQLLISRKVSEENWRLDTLLEAIEMEVAARERVSASQSRPHPRRTDSKPPASATSLVSTSAISTPCCFCNQSHSPVDCAVVPRIEDRKRILQRTGRCFSCLRKGHLNRDCRSRGRCRACKGRHHTSICQQRPEQDSDSHQPTSKDGVTLTVTSPTPVLNPEAQAFTPPSDPPTLPTEHTLCSHSDQMILLQTAVAEVFHPGDPSRRLKVGVVFDRGSQKSYM